MKKMNRPFPQTIILLFLFLTGFQLSPYNACAYDEDTHFIMTYVMLRSAGFTDNDALLVAAIDQGMDDSPETVANGNIGPVSGVYPNVDEEWIWHALDSSGSMTARGIIARKEYLFAEIFNQADYRTKLILLGIFYHYQQDTWAHRHHWSLSPLGSWEKNHLSYDNYITYNTPTGHAKDGHFPDRPPFDPVCALMCLEDGIQYAVRFLQQTGGSINPFFAGYKPMSGKLDEEWKDDRQGKYFNQVKLPGPVHTTAEQANAYLANLIHAQINSYTYSKTNAPLPGFQTPNKVSLDTVRINLQMVCDSFSAQVGNINIPNQDKKTALGFNSLTTPGLLAVYKKMFVTQYSIDSMLKPGDFMFKFLGSDNKTGLPVVGMAFEKLITAGQMAYKAGSGIWNDMVTDDNSLLHQAKLKGNPNAVHMGIYIGDSKIAEAYGTSLNEASVTQWGLFNAHNFQSWYIFRPKDTAFAGLVTRVAGNWASGRIKYLIPAEAAVTNSWFGPQAKERALVYAKAFSSPGGPESVSKMFCSQFAIAAAQSAGCWQIWKEGSEHISTDQLDQLPAFLKIDSFSSPVTVFGEWGQSGMFELIGPVYLQKDPL